jgi:hypothetical protein
MSGIGPLELIILIALGILVYVVVRKRRGKTDSTHDLRPDTGVEPVQQAPTAKADARPIQVFINYRREDSANARLVYDRLRGRFGREHVFMDVDTLQPGQDFVSAINERVSSCDALIAVIGRAWLAQIESLKNSSGFVRLELTAAFERKIPVVPVLVDGVKMPGPQGAPRGSCIACASSRATDYGCVF